MTIEAQQKIDIKAEIKKSVATKRNDLDIKLTITNQEDTPCLVYKYDQLGYPLQSDPKSYFEIQRMKKNTFVSIPLDDQFWANVLPVPLYDSVGNRLEDITDTLKKDNPYSLYFNPANVYGLTKGKYRVRIAIKILQMPSHAYNYLKSNWVTFEVRSKWIKLF